MSIAANAWLSAARLRRRLRRADPDWRDALRRDLIARHVPGRSFTDLGCMWNANGKWSFLAEELGATAVTAVDASPATPEFLAEHERRRSDVRFVRGDLVHESVYQQVGPHDVVWCTGVLYHTPHPFWMLQRFLSVTADILILGTLTIPEVPGLPQASVFYPGLSDAGRAPYARVWSQDAVGISTPLERDPDQSYANYWFGISPSALVAMLDLAGFEVLEVISEPDPFDTHIVARRSAAAGRLDAAPVR